MAMLGIFLSGSLKRALLSRAELRRFQLEQEVEHTYNSGVLHTSPAVDFSLWSSRRIDAYEESLLARFAQPLAVLGVSRVRLRVPVLEGTSSAVLDRAVGHILGTALPGQQGTVGIAGHRDSFFRVLKELRLGDTIELQTENGIYEYRVNKLLVVDPNDIGVLQSTRTASLTLVTCYPFYFVGSAPKRYIVEATITGLALAPKSITNGPLLEPMQKPTPFVPALRNSGLWPSKSFQEMTQ
jgi:sortase A